MRSSVEPHQLDMFPRMVIWIAVTAAFEDMDSKCADDTTSRAKTGQENSMQEFSQHVVLLLTCDEHSVRHSRPRQMAISLCL
jgi:hypothetical protein